VAAVVVGLFVLDSRLAPIFGSAPNEHAELQAALLAEANRVGDGGTVTMSDVYKGDWDRVWIWDGYAADRQHNVFPGVDFGDGGYGVDYVVAFGLDGKLVRWVRFNVNDPIVYFDPPDEGQSAGRADARFRVTHDANYPGPLLIPE
jgi:hypothetical protein